MSESDPSMTQNDLKGFRFRESTRAPYETEVRLRFDRFGGAVSGYSADISMEGMFVKTKEPKPVGTLVQFEFKLEQIGELIQGLGDVVWIRTRHLAPTKPPGMGIQFRYLDPHSRELIFKIVDKYLKAAKEEAGQESEATPASPPVPPGAGVPPSGVAPDEVSLGAGETSAPAAGAPAPVVDDEAPATLMSEHAAALDLDTESPGSPSPSAPVAPPSTPSQPPFAPSVDSSPPAPAVDSLPTQGDPLATSLIATPDPASESPAAGAGETPSPPPILPPILPEVSSPMPPPIASSEAAESHAGEALFVPEDLLIPEAAATVGVGEDTGWTGSGTGSAPPGPLTSPFQSGGSHAASTGGRKWLPVLLVLLGVLAGAGYFFKDQILGLVGFDSATGPIEAPITAIARPPEGGATLPGDPGDVADGVTDNSTEAQPTQEGDVPEVLGGEEPSAAATVTDVPEPVAAASSATPPVATAAPAADLPPAIAGQRFSSVSEINWQQGASSTVVTVVGDGPIQPGDFTELQLANPPRLLVRLFGITEPYPTVSVDTPELRQVRCGLHDGDDGRALHLVFDLAAPDVRTSAEIVDGLLRIRLSGGG